MDSKPVENLESVSKAKEDAEGAGKEQPQQQTTFVNPPLLQDTTD